jgi:hypothetical protein
MLTIAQACRLIGGDERPIHPATYYRGVSAGRYPTPVHITPKSVRVPEHRLLEALARLMGEVEAA